MTIDVNTIPVEQTDRLINEMRRKKRESVLRSELINGLAINWQHAQQIIPYVLNEPKEITSQILALGELLDETLSEMEDSVKQLRNFIPTNNG